MKHVIKWTHPPHYVFTLCASYKEYIQGGSNMTGTDCGLFTHKSVPVIFESPCIYTYMIQNNYSNICINVYFMC
jgi:hypothetical protein